MRLQQYIGIAIAATLMWGCGSDAALPASDADGLPARTALSVESGEAPAKVGKTGQKKTGSSSVARQANRVAYAEYVEANKPCTVEGRDVRLVIDSGAVAEGVQIEVAEVPAEASGNLQAGLANVTAGGAVYRMLPDGMRFRKEIGMAMKYDSTSLPHGYTAEDVYTFFFNEQTGRWQAVERDSVDTRRCIVYSRTDHFTDYINGVLAVPENSDAVAYTPTSIKELKAADPLEGIALIAPPEANRMGTANLDYPLSLPAGRHGMQPQLSVAYSSGATGGVLGAGWNLPVSEIGVETRWGVPLYSRTMETEGYLLEGATLVAEYTDSSGLLRREDPVYHHAYKARRGGRQTFRPRQEGAFRRIERIGDSPDRYRWEVTGKDGVRHVYGQTARARLCDPNGNIARWLLEKSIDPYGNSVTYRYGKHYENGTSAGGGMQVLLEQIVYTGNERMGDTGVYSVRFHYTGKADKGRTFRQGVEETDAWLLDHITVACRGETVREYYFGYRRGVFGKTLLGLIAECYADMASENRYESFSGEAMTLAELPAYERCNLTPAGGSSASDAYPVIAHTFDYYGLEESLFGEAELLDDGNTPDETLFDRYGNRLTEHGSLGGSASGGWNASGGINAGLGIDKWVKALTVGGHYAYSNDTVQGLLTLVDLDGDGYPDKLYRSADGSLRCRRQVAGENRFGAAEPVSGVGSFLGSSSSSHSWGAEASAAGMVGGGACWTDSRSSTSTYLADANGDGLADIVSNGRVFINRGNLHFDDVTENDTLQIGGSCGGGTISFGGEVDTLLFDDGWYTVERLECEADNVVEVQCDTLYEADGEGWWVSCTDVVVATERCHTVVDTFYYTYPNRYEPDIDLIRMWVAPYSGVVQTGGRVSLTSDLDDLREASRTRDGVWASVHKAGDTSLLASAVVRPRSGADLSASTAVSAGDTLFFRLNALERRLYDLVDWNPTVAYSQVVFSNGAPASPAFTDANGDTIGRFAYAQDFMLAATGGVSTGDTSGSVAFNTYAVQCSISSAAPLSQAVAYSIYRRELDSTGSEQLLLRDTLPPGSTFSRLCRDTVGPVGSNQELVLRLEPLQPGQVRWSAVEAAAEVSLVATTSSELSGYLQDSLLRQAYVYHPAVERIYYDYLAFPGECAAVAADSTIRVRLLTPAGQPLHGSLTLYATLKRDGASHARSVAVNDGVGSMEGIPSAGSYCIDFYLADSAAAIGGIQVSSDGSVWHQAGLYTKRMPNRDKHHGTLYRGWGQFGYKSATGQYRTIDSRQIHAPAYYCDSAAVPQPDTASIAAIDTTGVDEDSSPETPLGSVYGGGLGNSFFEMRADGKLVRWCSFGNAVTATRTLCSLDNGDAGPDEESAGRSADLTQSPLPVVAAGRRLKAVNKLSMGKSFGYTVMHASSSRGHSRQLGDYMDLNGDRYPDNISEKEIQYSMAQGGLGNLKKGYASDAGISRSTNSTRGLTPNGSFLNAVGGGGQNPKKAKVDVKSTSCAPFLNGGSTSASETTASTFLDINGDGLPDIVYADGQVRYNTGYGFTGLRQTPVGLIRQSSSHAVSAGVGVNAGINICNTSITGGLNINQTLNRTDNALMDINGDGWPDRVDPDAICIARGDGTCESYGGVGVDKGKTTSIGLASSATLDVVAFVFFVPVKVGASVGGGVSAGLNASEAEFVDMDNDGFPDYVYSENGRLYVRHSAIGRANLLQHVSNFAGAEYTIGYAMGPSSTASPQRHWEMASLKIYDGHPGDGADTLYRRYAYSGRRYDRYEREDYGNATVQTLEYMTAVDFRAGTPCRTTTRHYLNGDPYHAGLLTLDSMDAHPSGRRATRYAYRDADLLSGSFIPDSVPAWCHGDTWPALAAETSLLYEASDPAPLASRREYQYGPYGNVVRCTDLGDPNDPADNYTVHIGYDTNGAAVYHTVANVASLHIPGYRRRTASYNPRGSMTGLSVFNGDDTSVYRYTYDGYGNTDTVFTPAFSQADGKPYWISYSYDDMAHALPVLVANADGYRTGTDYDLRWQKPLWTSDPGGSTIEYTYDSHGRTQTLTAPFELASSQPYTIHYDYWYAHPRPQAAASNPAPLHPVWARTSNRMAAYGGYSDIDTYVFSDGLGRTIQTKRNVDDSIYQRVVSGTARFDALGRRSAVMLPFGEGDNIPPLHVNRGFDSQALALADYDLLDRPLRQVNHDGTTVLYAYSLAADAAGIRRLRTRLTDPNGHTSASFSDARGLQVQSEDALGGTTRLHYDAVGQLTQSTDPEGNTTYHKYDLGGRRIRRDHPAAGTIVWTYDPAGHVVRQTTASGDTIRYTYDHNRLIQVSYPARPWNDVHYLYGDSLAGTDAGRVVRVQDASGVEERHHDEMGNVVFSRHTYVFPQCDRTLTLLTRWVYDSYGRIASLVYPDGERVRFTYNLGGQLFGVEGHKDSIHHTTYADDIHYNVHGLRISELSGSGLRTVLRYNARSLRLERVLTYRESATSVHTLTDLRFSYDPAGNVLSAVDSGLSPRRQDYAYDACNRLVSSSGTAEDYWSSETLTYGGSYAYSPAGRLTARQTAGTGLNPAAGLNGLARSHTYLYGSGGNPYAVTAALDMQAGGAEVLHCGWDSQGNLAQVRDLPAGATHRLCWTEENRLQGYRKECPGDTVAAWYAYGADGERSLKLASRRMPFMIIQNGKDLSSAASQVGAGGGLTLADATLYATPLLTLTRHGYTKHYFDGTRRLCSRLGGGFEEVDTGRVEPVEGTYGLMHRLQRQGVQAVFAGGAALSPAGDLRRALEREKGRRAAEPAYYYHTDHLGSTTLLTDSTGNVVQALSYLPYGEDWSEYNEMQRPDSLSLGQYRFNGKERDPETGFLYYSQRYYGIPIIPMWLSVDPMLDKYPGISPYAYCNWNPVRLIDPDGRKWKETSDAKQAEEMKAQIQQRIKDIEADIVKYQKIADNRSARGRSTEKFSAQLSDLQNQKELLNDFVAGLGKLEESDVIYTFNPTRGEYHEVSIFATTESVYQINYQTGNDANMVHETTHAIQAERARENPAITASRLNMEVGAYSTQYSYSPSSMPESDSGIIPSSRISKEWVKRVYYYNDSKRYPYKGLK